MLYYSNVQIQMSVHVSGGQFERRRFARNGSYPSSHREAARPFPRAVIVISLLGLAFFGFLCVNYLNSRINEIERQSTSLAPVTIATSVVTVSRASAKVIQGGTPRPTSSTVLPTLVEKSSLIPTSTTTSSETSAVLPSVRPRERRHLLWQPWMRRRSLQVRRQPRLRW